MTWSTLHCGQTEWTGDPGGAATEQPALGPQATITADAATGGAWQVVVIGAGPAGASAAARLAAGGIRTLLIDRHAMPRRKVCGCCLSVAADAELRSLGDTPAGDALASLRRAPLETVRLLHRGRSVALPLAGGGVMSRETLDPALVRGAIAAGCDWLPGCQVATLDDSAVGGAAVDVVLSGGPGPLAGERRCVLRADYVVLATGLADQVRITPARSPQSSARSVASASRIGVGASLSPTALELPAGELVMAISRGGYCGLVRLENGCIDLAAAVDRAELTRHAEPAAAVAAIVAEAAGDGLDPVRFSSAVHSVRFQATPSLTRRAALVAGGSGRILRVGDAAGYVEPFTGEGIGWALAGGRLLATALLPQQGGGLAPPAAVGLAYPRAHQRHFAGQHRRCQRVAGLIRRPAVVSAALQAAQAVPWVARRVVPAIVGAGGTTP